MTSSVFVLVLVVAGVYSAAVDTSKWDAAKADIETKDEKFIKDHPELNAAFELIKDVWSAVADYDCVVEGADSDLCEAIRDSVHLIAEEIAGLKPSAEEVAKELSESDAAFDEEAEAGMEISKAVLDYIGKKQGKKAAPLLALFDSEVKEGVIPIYSE